MDSKKIEKLSHCDLSRNFLTKPYSIELMFLLLENDFINGIEELLASIKSHKPKMPSFIYYLSLLEEAGCIKKEVGEDKKSKRTVMLTDACRDAINAILVDEND